MKNKLVFGLIVLAFFIGTLYPSIINLAKGDTVDPYATIIAAIGNLTSAVKSNESPISLTTAGSNTGNFTLPSGPFDVLFYGPTLCHIGPPAYFTPTTFLIQFGSSTLVQNHNLTCKGGVGNIILSGGIDHTFGEGDKLILNRNPNNPPWIWTEVARVTS